MDLLKRYLDRNGELSIDCNGDYHIIKLTKDYVLLKESEEKHEIKFYFDKESFEDLLFIDALHKLQKKKAYVFVKIIVDMFKDDFEKPKEATAREMLEYLKDILDLKKKYKLNTKVYASDIDDLVVNKTIDIVFLINILNKKKTVKEAIKEYEKYMSSKKETEAEKDRCKVKVENQDKCRHRFNDECLKFGNHCRFVKEDE